MKITKRIVLLLLVVCMLITCSPVIYAESPYNCTATEKAELQKFLNRFQFYWLGDYNCLDPAASTDPQKVGILSGIISNPLVINYEDYPVVNDYTPEPDLTWENRKDPKKKWNQYWRTSETTVNWLLKNIFSCTDEQIAQMNVLIDKGVDPFAYRYKGSYYTMPLGTGMAPYVGINQVTWDGYHYRVTYTVKMTEFGQEEVLGSGYAVFDRITVSGKKYWQLKSNCYNYNSRPIADTPFLDVTYGDYFSEPVYFMYKWNFVNGTGKETFSPDQICSRAQAVTFLWRRAGEPEPSKSAPTFKDVPSSEYYAKAVSWAAEKGITSGVGDGYFAPDSNCSRAQIVTFIHRSEGKPSLHGNISFYDVPASAYYYDAVVWAVTKGITLGTGPNTFSPDAPCTRAQIVTFLYRANSY